MAQLDPTQVKQLVQNLIDGEEDLTAKQQANADAVKSSAQSVADAQAALAKSQADAAAATAKAAGDLQAAQATNRANVNAVKQYFSSLDDEGNEPDEADPNADTGEGDENENATGDTGTTTMTEGGLSEVAGNPATNANAPADEELKPRRTNG